MLTEEEIKQLPNKLNQPIVVEINFSGTKVSGVLKEYESEILTIATKQGLRYFGRGGIKKIHEI